ncbi:hypothetical protein CEXT_475161 [Caerostris extrusa]|uniref:Uncharacterized protein n=1 Tax=Caerostris extrusa TaxID=172846 RepID=A0AAV4RL42_CAEEX|nr:hypothetical protein CEXT_475161 [Caerostris extrusa]
MTFREVLTRTLKQTSDNVSLRRETSAPLSKISALIKEVRLLCSLGKVSGQHHVVRGNHYDVTKSSALVGRCFFFVLFRSTPARDCF